MNVRHPFSIKNISYDKMDLKIFYFEWRKFRWNMNLKWIQSDIQDKQRAEIYSDRGVLRTLLNIYHGVF